MFMVFHAKRILSILCLTILVLGGIIITGNRTLVPVSVNEELASEERCYIIDAGHGGEDGGAVASSGISESDLNLKIALRTEKLLNFCGSNTAMTRHTPQAIYDDGARTLREKKRSDLQNRVKLVNQYQNPVLISIHQNSMPSVPEIHGAQVFYNAVSPADRYAQQLQYTLNTAINPGNEKEAKKIGPDIYLTRNVKCPAVLVECGFLSNTEDTAALQEPKHQKTIAAAIAAGILNDANGA